MRVYLKEQQDKHFNIRFLRPGDSILKILFDSFYKDLEQVSGYKAKNCLQDTKDVDLCGIIA